MPKRHRDELSDSDSEYSEDSDLFYEKISPPPLKKRRVETYIQIDYKKLTSLESLIELINQHKETYNFDIIQLKNILPELKQLNELIGMEDVKKAITFQVLFFVQNLGMNDMMHTVIQGPPGCGKTTLAQIVAKIYLKLGFLKNEKFIIAKRTDLIGEYLGQTAKKTQRMIDKAQGGVLFIDEAYALGANTTNSDSYSKECLDTLNQNLSEKKADFVCIIAGYKEDLKRCFFARNQGLERRFPWIYDIKKYNHQQLYEIFIKIVIDNGWVCETGSISPEFFKKNKDNFPHFGGSLETLFAKVKMVHSQRVFGQPVHTKKIINKEDIERGFKLYMDFENKEEKINSRKPPPGLYI